MKQIYVTFVKNVFFEQVVTWIQISNKKEENLLENLADAHKITIAKYDCYIPGIGREAALVLVI